MAACISMYAYMCVSTFVCVCVSVHSNARVCRRLAYSRELLGPAGLPCIIFLLSKHQIHGKAVEKTWAQVVQDLIQEMVKAALRH